MRQYSNFYPNINIKQRIAGFVQSKNPVNRLIVINICIYLLVVLVRFLYNNPEKEVADSFILQWIGISPNWDIFIFRPWTLFTSLFLHLKFWHILFNMIMLWLAGQIFIQFIPAKKIYWIYILGGLVGNVLFVLLYNYFPVFQDFAYYFAASGVVGGVLAVFAAAATKVPNYPVRLFFIGEIRLKWIAIFFILWDFINIPVGNSGGHFANLGGALFGFLFIIIPVLQQKIQTIKPKKTIRFKQKPSNFRSKTDEQYNAERAEYRKEVDEILDKVAKSGYSSLSKAEKEFLFNTSQKKNW